MIQFPVLPKGTNSSSRSGKLGYLDCNAIINGQYIPREGTPCSKRTLAWEDGLFEYLAHTDTGDAWWCLEDVWWRIRVDGLSIEQEPTWFGSLLFSPDSISICVWAELCFLLCICPYSGCGFNNLFQRLGQRPSQNAVFLLHVHYPSELSVLPWLNNHNNSMSFSLLTGSSSSQPES